MRKVVDVDGDIDGDIDVDIDVDTDVAEAIVPIPYSTV